MQANEMNVQCDEIKENGAYESNDMTILCENKRVGAALRLSEAPAFFFIESFTKIGVRVKFNTMWFPILTSNPLLWALVRFIN